MAPPLVTAAQTHDTEPMIRFDNVAKRYATGHEGLSGVDLHLEPGEMAFLTGHSGAGKSTLLRLIGLLERATRGQVWVNGRNLNKLKTRDIPYHRREVGMIFQDHRLLHDRTVFDNIALPLVVIVALPLAFVWSAGFKAGAVTTVYVLAAALAAALLNLWHPVPGRRGDILRRHSQSKLVAMMEHMLSLLWAVALALTAFGSWAAMVPILCALFLLWTQRPKAVLATA